MNKIMILLVALVFTSSPAFAFFTNLGFETGDTSGWTIDKDYSVISSYTGQFNNTSDWEADIPFYGDYSLLLGSPGVGNEYDHAHQGKASQIAAISHADIVSGLDLYLEWGAILEEPTNAVVHTKDEQPYFSIAVSSSDDDGATWSSLYYANQYANESGLTYLGTNARGASGNIWYGSGSTIIDLAGLSEGDLLKIKLFVRDKAYRWLLDLGSNQGPTD